MSVLLDPFQNIVAVETGGVFWVAGRTSSAQIEEWDPTTNTFTAHSPTGYTGSASNFALDETNNAWYHTQGNAVDLNIRKYDIASQTHSIHQTYSTITPRFGTRVIDGGVAYFEDRTTGDFYKWTIGGTTTYISTPTWTGFNLANNERSCWDETRNAIICLTNDGISGTKYLRQLTTSGGESTLATLPASYTVFIPVMEGCDVDPDGTVWFFTNSTTGDYLVSWDGSSFTNHVSATRPTQIAYDPGRQTILFAETTNVIKEWDGSTLSALPDQPVVTNPGLIVPAA